MTSDFLQGLLEALYLLWGIFYPPPPLNKRQTKNATRVGLTEINRKLNLKENKLQI